jgi:uncharacterized protein (DUF2235 family)
MTQKNPDPQRSKRLILFFDGTWMDADDETNVYLFAKNVLPYDNDGKRQKFYYSPGVGSTTITRVPGGVFGCGLKRNILAGYEWLCQNYDDGDEIWIFGFSRGAYTARSLAGMIRKSGLLYITNPAMLNQALLLYRNKDYKPGPQYDHKDKALVVIYETERAAYEFRKRFSREVTIHFMGMWDTVSALGFPGARHLNKKFEWHDTQLSKIVRRAYHALAIDEQREIFDALLWTRGQSRVDESKMVGQIIEQRWFVGSHGNIGGGVDEDRTLSDISLKWMEDKAANAGLQIRRPSRVTGDIVNAPIYLSYDRFAKGAYRLVRETPILGKGRYPRKVITDSKLTKAINPCIDPSVKLRWDNDPTYRPLGLGNIEDQVIGG